MDFVPTIRCGRRECFFAKRGGGFFIALISIGTLLLSFAASAGEVAVITSTNDAFVWGGSHAGATNNNSTLVVKADNSADNQRKIYVGFDTTGIRRGTVAGAVLKLQLSAESPTNNLTLNVYGLNDSAFQDGWNESMLTWSNAPQNLTNSGIGLQAGATLLGALTVPALTPVSNVVVFSNATTAAFVNSNLDSRLTFIVTGQTPGAAVNFAAHEASGGLPGPQLELSLNTTSAAIINRLRWPAFAQSNLDAAFSTPLLALANNQIGQTYSAKAVHFLALAVYQNANATNSAGSLLRTQLLAQLRSLITGGNEPYASGSLAGRTHNPVAHAFVLAQRTPAVWNALTATERDKIDWLMRAMAIAGHWSFDDDNDFKTGLRNDGGFRKTFNPNFREPYVGVVLAASLYFGANALNSAFTNFNYDTYLAAFTNYGFSNVLNAWQTFVTNTPAHTWKALLENGGADDYGGTGAGVRSAFTYQGVPLTNPMGIFRKLTEYTYGPPVIDGLGTNSFTLNGGSSPYLGQKGMLLEFNSSDGNGPRSDANYAWLGWNCNVTTAATLMALGLWQNGYDNVVVQNLMEVGSEDLLYKLSAGFHSFALGVFSTNYTDATQNPKGYNFDRDLWRTERLLFALNQTIQGEVRNVAGSDYQTVTFVRRKSPLPSTLMNVVFLPQITSDFVTWSAVGTQVGPFTDNGDGITETVVFRDDTAVAPKSARFIRLRATNP